MPNGGALYAGGVPGNKGGRGATPKAIRAAFRADLNDRLKILRDIADDVTAKHSDRMDALEMMARYGVGAASAALDDKGNALNPSGVPSVVTVRFVRGRSAVDGDE